MAKQIINRSMATVRVFVNIAGSNKIIILPPGMQTAPIVEPIAVAAMPFGELMESRNWFKILTEKAVIYTWIKNSEHDLSDYSSLHCVPFIKDNSTGIFNTGYHLFSSPASDILVDENPANVENVSTVDPKDGEFNMPDQPFFGAYVRTSIGDDIYITVRLWLKRLLIDENELEAVKPVWKKDIESVWNDGDESSTHKKYHFEVDWTDGSSHSVVFATNCIFSRSNMFLWVVKKDSETEKKHMAAHEYGHHLGLSDGYLYHGEFPYLEEKMIELMPDIYKGKTISMTFETYFWQRVGGLMIKKRVEERITNGELKGEFNLMLRANSLIKIDSDLIDSIENQVLQKLYLSTKLFQERENDFFYVENNSKEKK